MQLYPRDILQQLIPNLEYRDFIIIAGPRQSGKTSVLKLIKSHLEEKQKTTFYISLEDPRVLSQLNGHPEALFSFIPKTEHFSFILIDEIQYLKDPTNFLKYHFDFHSEKIKMICTGSSAFYIDQKFKDSLAGRKQLYNLYTLNFNEFLYFKTGSNELSGEISEIKLRPEYQPLRIGEIKNYLNEYLTYGGYPEVVLSKTEDRKLQLLRELTQSFLKRDFLETGIKNEEKFFDLIRLLAYQTGGLVNTNQLANSLQLSGTAIDNYLMVLKKSFHVHLLKPFFRNIKKELTKMPKIYFHDLGFRNMLLNQFIPVSSRLDKGELIENFVFCRLRDSYNPEDIRYWRTADGNEIDFIVNTAYNQGFAIECKFSQQSFSPKKYSKFISEYPGYPLRVKAYEYFDNSVSLLII